MSYNCKSIAVIGYGYMGEIYVRILLDLGIAPEQIMVADVDPVRLQACKSKHPCVRVMSLDDVLAARPDAAFVLTNSPSHITVLQRLHVWGVPHIYCEKPLVLASQIADCEPLLGALQTFVCGYLINFSQAVAALVDMMHNQTLRVLQGRCFWGKDRSPDTRATGGDLEDETTHGYELLMSLARINQSVLYTAIESASLDYIPYVDAAVQSAAHNRDASYPETPDATCSAVVRVQMSDLRFIRLFLSTSFLAFDQERRVDLLLAPPRVAKPTMKARLLFDTPEGDVLLVGPMGGQAPERRVFPAKQKLRDQIDAFLRAPQGDIDPRLVHGQHALDNVRFARAVRMIALQA